MPRPLRLLILLLASCTDRGVTPTMKSPHPSSPPAPPTAVVALAEPRQDHHDASPGSTSSVPVCADQVHLPFERFEGYDGHSGFLVLSADGSGELLRGRSDLRTYAPEVGVYRACVTATDIDALAELLNAPSDTDRHPPPGTPGLVATIDRRHPDGSLTTTFVRGALPGRVQASIERIGQAAVLRPLRTLQAEVSALAVDVTGTTRGTLVLSNRGVESVTVPYPRQLGLDLWPQTRSGADRRPKPGPDRCDGCMAAVAVDSVEPLDGDPSRPATLTLPPGGRSSFRFTTHLTSMRLTPYHARIVLERSGVRGTNARGETTRLLSDPVELAPPPIATAFPDPATFTGVTMTPGCQGLMSDEQALPVLVRARELVIFDPLRDGVSVPLGCQGTLHTTRGSFTVIYEGGRGRLLIPGGRPVVFEWDP